MGRGFKGSHPRDIVDLIMDICVYHGESPAFSRRHLDAACQSYFVSLQPQLQSIERFDRAA
jgi:hypothetical protein